MLITKEKILKRLENDLSEPNVLIFKNAVNIDIKEEEVTLHVEDEYMKQWIETKCLPFIQNYTHLPIEIIIKESQKEDVDQLELFEEQVQHKPTRFNSLFTFEKFIVGNNNRFAFAAAEAVAKRPANAYNPLFIYGSVGIGKTHLLQAIANEVSKKNLNVCLVTSEKFTNDLINSLRNKATADFKNKYRNIDVLLIDDIQFLAGKESTQEEFFHTFNELHGQNKQIVMTSDRPPNDIPTLQDRLKTRFGWGLTADIQPPELETRIAILKTKLEHTRTKLNQDVLEYVASQFPNNVRELEGALNRITAYSNLMNAPIDFNSASQIIKDLINEHQKRPLTIPQIKRIVSKKLNISIEELASKARTKDIVQARQIAMYLCREVTNISLLKIGENFGNRDHSTVMHAIDKIKQQVKHNDDVKNIVEELKNHIQTHCG